MRETAELSFSRLHRILAASSKSFLFLRSPSLFRLLVRAAESYFCFFPLLSHAAVQYLFFQRLFSATRENHPRAVNPLIYSRRFLEFCQPRPQSALVLFTLLVLRRRSSLVLFALSVCLSSLLSHSPFPRFVLFSSSPSSSSKSKLTSSLPSLPTVFVLITGFSTGKLFNDFLDVSCRFVFGRSA